MTGIVIPLFEDEPFVPDIQVVYWLDTAILPPDVPEDQRPMVVMAVPDTTTGTIRVATHSSTQRWGIPHPRTEALGLSTDGWFSRRANLLGELWTRCPLVADRREHRRYRSVRLCSGRLVRDDNLVPPVVREQAE